MKLEWLRDRHGDRVATMATATPIANSITEAHVMTRYLRPDLLQAAGIEDFDAWAATFGQTVTEIEVAPTGGGDYRMHTRFARFQNVPEMLRLWHVFADVKTAEDLQLPAPELAERPRRAARPGDGADRPEPRAPVLRAGARAPRRRRPRPDGHAGGGQHAQGHHRRPQSRARHPARHRAEGLDTRQARPRRRHHRPPLARAPRPDLPHPVRRPLADHRRAADRLLRPLHTQPGSVERLRRAAPAARRPRPPRPTGQVHPRGAQRRREGPPVRRLPRRPRLACWSARRRRWGWGPTSRTGASRSTTSTAPGARPTSSSATAAACARATRTPRSTSSATPPKGASTPTAGRPSSGKPGSSTRSCAAASTSARSRTSARTPSASPRSKRSPRATR